MNKFLFRIKEIYVNLSLPKKSVIWFTFATIIQNGISFLTTPLYTRILSDSEYGIYSIFQSWQQIISILSVLALDRCITVGFMKFSEERRNFLSSIQTLMTLLIFCCSIIIYIFSDFFEGLIKLPLYMIFTMLVVSLMNNSLTNWSWYQRYLYDYRKLTCVTIFSAIFMQIISIISLLLLPLENKGNVLVMTMSGSRILIFGIIYLSVFFKGKTAYNKKYWCFGIKYSIAVVPHALAQIILNSSDRIMIDKICGRSETAYYSVTYSAAMVLNTIMTSVSSAVQPWFFEEIKNRNYQKIRTTTNSLLLFSAGLSVFVSLFAPEILRIMAPASYSEALWIFPSIAASVYFNSMYLYFANFESYYEKPFYFSIATSVGAVVNIVLNLILIPVFGFVAAGYTTLFCYILFAIMHYIFMRKVCLEFIHGEKVFDLKFIIILSIIVLILNIGITLLYTMSVIRYILICLFIFVLYIKRSFFANLIKSYKKNI